MVHREPSVPIDHNGARRWTPVAFQTITRGRVKNGARRLTGGLRKTGEGRSEGGPGLRQSIARLQQASSAAVSTLLKVMVDANAPASTRRRTWFSRKQQH